MFRASSFLELTWKLGLRRTKIAPGTVVTLLMPVIPVAKLIILVKMLRQTAGQWPKSQVANPAEPRHF